MIPTHTNALWLLKAFLDASIGIKLDSEMLISELMGGNIYV